MLCHNEQLGSYADFIEANMEFARKRALGSAQEQIQNQRDFTFRQVKMDSGTTLHMMSKNEITSGEKETIIRSKEPTVITTANGKAESTQEATVYVNDLDAFITMMLLEHLPAVLSLGLFGEDMDYSCHWKKGESPSLVRDGKL